MLQILLDVYSMLHPEIQQVAQNSIVELLNQEYSAPLLIAYLLKDVKVNINIHWHK
ncbi:hypothetical protein [Photobacterium leiognathi]|uniref:hypothetical protein n=1 Tax=Photobacterium leiognathi TaxID=553611 RepID=UPI002738990A|nr:hypothetical protein [Photobacterium leiognathi]